MVSLSVQKHVELIWLLFLFNLEGELALHLKEDLVDVHEFWEEVGSRKDEFLRQIYEGQFVNKKAHGKGTMRWNQGDKYEGDWKEGLRHGKGEYWSKVSIFD